MRVASSTSSVSLALETGDMTAENEFSDSIHDEAGSKWKMPSADHVTSDEKPGPTHLLEI